MIKIKKILLQKQFLLVAKVLLNLLPIPLFRDFSAEDECAFAASCLQFSRPLDFYQHNIQHEYPTQSRDWNRNDENQF